MNSDSFNPFPVSLDKLEGKHLKVLTEVSEGWYIDYKQEIIHINKISKHLASFANQYGGWLFFGIKESEDRKAGVFMGIPAYETQKALATIREAATVKVNPYVHYEEKVFIGPVEEIGLPENQAIIAIHIPEGTSPPYVDYSGKIYRRLSDSSQPEPETDRRVLDLLWEKGEKRKKIIEEFLSKRPFFHNNKDPIIYIFFLSNPLFENKINHIKISDFEKIFKSARQYEGVTTPVDSVQSVHEGYMAKQIESNSPLQNLFSIRWWHNGNALVSIPLNSYKLNSSGFDNGSKHNYLDEFKVEANGRKLSTTQACDFSYFVIALVGIFNRLLEIYDKTGNKEKLFASFSIENVGGMVPFIDDKLYIEQIRENGIPIIEDNIIKVPKDFNFIELLNLEIAAPSELMGAKKSAENTVKLMPIFFQILNSVGVVRDLKDIIKFTSLLSTSKHSGIV